MLPRKHYNSFRLPVALNNRQIVIALAAAATLACVIGLSVVSSSSSGKLPHRHANFKRDSGFQDGHHSEAKRSFADTAELKKVIKGEIGFLGGNLKRSFVEERIEDTRSMPEAAQYYQNLMLRLDERENWSLKKYSNKLACVVPLDTPKDMFAVERITSTYGEVCDRLFFFVGGDVDEKFIKEIKSHQIQNMEIVKLQTSRPTADDGKSNLWERTHLMWTYLSKHHGDEFDWFVKIDKHTFLAVQAMKEYLKFYDPNVYHYIGHTLFYQIEVNAIFNSGSCYVLSKSAIQRLQLAFEDMPTSSTEVFGPKLYSCMDRPGAGEDSTLGICLRGVGINPENTVDEEGKQRFLLFRHGGHRIYARTPEHWYWKHKPEGVKDLEECCVPSHEILAEAGFGDNARDSREFRRLHRRHLRWHTMKEATSRIPPVPEFFFYEPSEGGLTLNWFGNLDNIPKGQRIFDGYLQTP